MESWTKTSTSPSEAPPTWRAPEPPADFVARKACRRCEHDARYVIVNRVDAASRAQVQAPSSHRRLAHPSSGVERRMSARSGDVMWFEPGGRWESGTGTPRDRRCLSRRTWRTSSYDELNHFGRGVCKEMSGSNGFAGAALADRAVVVIWAVATASSALSAGEAPCCRRPRSPRGERSVGSNGKVGGGTRSERTRDERRDRRAR